MNRLCLHAISTEWPSQMRCELGLLGGTPAVSQCKTCLRREEPTSVAIETKADLVASEITTVGTKGKPERIVSAVASQNHRNPFSGVELATAEKRAAVCDACEHNNGITRTRNGWSIYTVKCGLCGCGGLSLVRGTCRGEKWPAVDGAANGMGRARGISGTVGTVDCSRKLLLKCSLSPGDVVTLTAAVRDLHRAYPGEFVTDVETTAPELWENNPYVKKLKRDDMEVRTMQMHYPLINKSNQRPLHFLHGYTEYLESQLNLRIPLTEFKGDLHLDEKERSWIGQVEESFGYKGPFWIMMAGGKQDFTTKWWPPAFYQQVVDHFLGRVQFVQCGEKNHWHPPLKGVFNLVGKTNIRQFIRLTYHAEGVVCPITFAMHLAAAVPTKTNRLRPCVVVAGGREPPHWEAYPGKNLRCSLCCKARF